MLYTLPLRIDDGWLLAWYELISVREKRDCVAQKTVSRVCEFWEGLRYTGSKCVHVVCFYLWAKIYNRKQNNSLKSSLQWSTKLSLILLNLFVHIFFLELLNPVVSKEEFGPASKYIFKLVSSINSTSFFCLSQFQCLTTPLFSCLLIYFSGMSWTYVALLAQFYLGLYSQQPSFIAQRLAHTYSEKPAHLPALQRWNVRLLQNRNKLFFIKHLHKM